MPLLVKLTDLKFHKVMEAFKRTSMLVRKPSKGLTSQITSAPRKPLKQESKKVEVAMVEELKKANKGKKR